MKDFLRPVRVTVDRPPVDDDQRLYLRSYLFMRAMVGAIGIALPFVLVAIDSLWFDAHIRNSLSAYYYSGVRELFVGTLFATAIFLVTYKVFERNLDNTLSIVAGLAALAVALFPTGRPSDALPLSPLQDRLGEGVVKAIHFTGAGLFIASLGILCYWFGVREGNRPARPGRRSPTFWRWYHWTCAGVIAASLAFIVVAQIVGRPQNALLIGESLSVWAFGASWLMKGLELDILLGKTA